MLKIMLAQSTKAYARPKRDFPSFIEREASISHQTSNLFQSGKTSLPNIHITKKSFNFIILIFVFRQLTQKIRFAALTLGILDENTCFFNFFQQ